MADPGEPVLLYAHPSMDHLAKQIVERCEHGEATASKPASSLTPEVVADGKCPFHRSMSSSGLLARKNRGVVYRNTIMWDTFQDGFPNLFIQDVHLMAGKDVIFLGSFHDPSVIFEQLSVLYMFPSVCQETEFSGEEKTALQEVVMMYDVNQDLFPKYLNKAVYLARSFHFILPYFPTGTMERVDTEGQIATAKTLAIMMSSIPLTARGPVQICIFDIHALQERFYFSDNIIPRLESAIPLLLSTMKDLPDKDKLAVAFPDDGAFKRFHQFFPEYDTITCVKIRDGGKRIVKVKDGDPDGKHVVVVDDLVQTGGTLMQCGKALIEKGATAVSAYVTHPVFPNQSWKRFSEGDFRFQNFWITDSIPHATDICKHEPFKLLSLCTPIANMLMGYDLKLQS